MMTTAVTSAALLRSFESAISNVAAWLRAASASSCGYPARIIADTLGQRIVEAALPFYAVEADARARAGRSWVPEGRLVCGPCTVDLESGRVELTAHARLRGAVTFLLHWGHCALSIVTPDFRAARRGVLVYDVPPESLFPDGSDARFVQFCAEGPVSPLREADRLFVQSDTTRPPSAERVSYCARPLVRLAAASRVGFSRRVAMLLEHLALLFQFARALVRQPMMALLSSEVAYSALARSLDRWGHLQAVVVTCGSWGHQPLWMRGLGAARLHMIWYSQSPQPVTYLADKQKAISPRLRWMRVDKHWVWTPSLAEYFETHGVAGECEAVGPLLWCLPSPSTAKPEHSLVLAFDVPGVSNAVMLHQVGEVSNYYHPDNLKGFVEDIVSIHRELEVCTGSPLRIGLKMKRGLRPHYDPVYFERIEALISTGTIEQVDISANLFDVVRTAALVIAYPFTSPAYLAEQLGVPVLFYDPTGTVVRDDFPGDRSKVSFARGRAELLEVATSLLLPRARPEGSMPSC